MSSPKTRLFPRASSGPLLFQVPARTTPPRDSLPARPPLCVPQRKSEPRFPSRPAPLPRDSPRLRCRRHLRIRPAAAPGTRQDRTFPKACPSERPEEHGRLSHCRTERAPFPVGIRSRLRKTPSGALFPFWTLLFLRPSPLLSAVCFPQKEQHSVDSLPAIA